MRLVARGELTTAVGISHPSRYDELIIIGLQFEPQCRAGTISSGNEKIPTMEWMEDVVDSNFARIVGIVVV